MGIVKILVIPVALFVGLVLLPTVFNFSVASLWGISTDTPLYDIVNIMPYAFLTLIIIGCIWHAASD